MSSTLPRDLVWWARIPHRLQTKLQTSGLEYGAEALSGFRKEQDTFTDQFEKTRTRGSC